MRQITIDGRIGKNAEVLTTTTGRRYMKFPFANTVRRRGAEKTDWFEVLCYDERTIESLSSILQKGRYIIVTGDLDVTVQLDRSGKIWLNQDLFATNIYLPNVGGSRQDGTTTGAAAAEPTVNAMENPAATAPAPSPAPAPVPVASTSPAPSAFNDAVADEDDDLPF